MSGDDLFIPPDLVYVTYIRTTPEKVWEALTRDNIFRTIHGLEAESDWKTGSEWRYLSADGGVHDEGVILEADPPRRLKMSWRVVFMEEARKLGETTITYDIEKAGDNVVRLTMTQHQPNPIPRKFFEGGKQGWPYILSVLKSVLETGEGFTVEMKPPT